MLEKIPDLRERPVDYDLIKNSEDDWVITCLSGQQIIVDDKELLNKIKTLLITQMHSDSISEEAIPGKSVPKFYDTPVTRAVWPNHFVDTNRAHVSVKQVTEDNCHKTANRLLPEAADQQFELTFEEVPSKEDARKLVQSVTSPKLVQFGWETGGTYNHIETIHSFLVIAEADDEIICFQKLGYRLPYEIVNFEKVYEYWSKAAKQGSKNLLIKVIAGYQS